MTVRLEPRAAHGLRPLADRQQLGQRRAVDVGVEHADLQAEVAQRQREIDRGGGLADAALAGGHRDDRGDARNAGGALRLRLSLTVRVSVSVTLRSRRARSGRGGTRRGPAAALPLGGERDHRRLHAGDRLHRVLGALSHRLPGLHGSGIDADRKEHLVARHDLRQCAGLRQRRAVRPGHTGQSLQHLFPRHRHRFLPAPPGGGHSIALRPT
jgi:hypothetical protein